jgi:hypothetical protein
MTPHCTWNDLVLLDENLVKVISSRGATTARLEDGGDVRWQAESEDFGEAKNKICL